MDQLLRDVIVNEVTVHFLCRCELFCAILRMVVESAEIWRPLRNARGGSVQLYNAPKFMRIPSALEGVPKGKFSAYANKYYSVVLLTFCCVIRLDLLGNHAGDPSCRALDSKEGDIAIMIRNCSQQCSALVDCKAFNWHPKEKKCCFLSSVQNVTVTL